LVILSVGIPYFAPPFGGDAYFFWLPVPTITLGLLALLRRERGPLAQVGLIGAAGSAMLLLLPRLLVFVGGGILGLFGVD
jgi:hypothetical protein